MTWHKSWQSFVKLVNRLRHVDLPGGIVYNYVTRSDETATSTPANQK